MTALRSSSLRVSRRLLLQSSVVSAASVGIGSHVAPVFRAEAQATPELAAGMLPSPAGWRTWYLTSPDELRPAAPGAPSREEIDEVLRLQADRTSVDEAVVAEWGTGPAVITWNRLASELVEEFDLGPLPLNRLFAHLHTAIHDAVIAAWDSQLAHNRPGPGATSADVTPLPGVDAAMPSFPSIDAAVAGAASVVLTSLLPDAATGRFEAVATEAAESRLVAGVAFRSDIVAGLDLGRTIGERAVTRSREDGFATQWDPSTKPSGPGIWEPTPPGFADPAFPLAGTWKTWVMTSGDQFRPAPPPEHGSVEWQSELKMVQEIAANRTFEQERAAMWWGSNSPQLLSNMWARELIGKNGVDLPNSSQILADLNVAMMDALIAVWDGKFTWWASRPINEDPDLVTVIPTPPYPAYPGGYGAAMGAGSTMLGHYFPEVADDMADRAWEAAASRAWAGIHYVIDDDVALTLGRRVARLVCALPGTNEVEGA